MHSRDTIEFAALLAARGDALVESPREIDPDALRRTWRLGRDHVDGWLLRLHAASRSTSQDAVDDVLAATREMLLADVLARTWSLLLVARSRRTGDLDLEAIARNLLLGRLRTRRMLLEWLLDDPRTTEPAVDREVAAVDRLRRRTERWTDLLLAPLVRRYDLPEFGFDADRLQDFAAERGLSAARGTWPLILTGLRVAFEDLPAETEASQAANVRTIESILCCLPADVFEPDGPLRSLSHVRIRRSDPSRDEARTEDRLAAPRGRPLPPPRFRRDHVPGE